MKWLLEQRFASVLITLLIVGIGLSIASEFFLMPRNLMNVGRQISVVAIVALGQTLVIMSGGIDLSVGSNIGLSAVCSALVLKLTGSPELAILAALLCGTMVGLANGGLVAIARINPFIATLGMLSVARSAALLLTGGLPQEFRSWASFLGYGRIEGIPVSLSVLLHSKVPPLASAILIGALALVLIGGLARMALSGTAKMPSPARWNEAFSRSSHCSCWVRFGSSAPTGGCPIRRSSCSRGEVWFGEGWVDVPRYERTSLLAGHRVEGPAIIRRGWFRSPGQRRPGSCGRPIREHRHRAEGRVSRCASSAPRDLDDVKGSSYRGSR